MKAHLRVAVVGLGEAGATLHLPAFAEVPAIQIVGVCDADPRRSQSVSGARGVPAFDDFSTMLRSSQPDLVSVATPPESHADLCVEALAAGVHVFCEKPFVCSLAEADRVIEAETASGRTVTVNHEFREMPIFHSVIERIRSGQDGEIRFAQAWQQFDRPPWKETGWRGQLARRTLFEAGVHLLDILVALFGEPPQSVSVSTSAAGLDADNRDALVAAVLQFPRGRMATLIQNRLTKGEPQYLEVRADADRAAYRASFGGRARVSAGLFRSTTPQLRMELGASGLAWRERGTRRERIARNPRRPNVDATRRLVTRTVDAISSGRSSPSGSAHARCLTAIVEACYESAARGARVAVDAGGRTSVD